MNKSTIRDIIYIIIITVLLVFGIRFIIWIFPVLILLIIGYYIYRSIKMNKIIRNANNNKNKQKNKKIKVIHEFDDED